MISYNNHAMKYWTPSYYVELSYLIFLHWNVRIQHCSLCIEFWGNLHEFGLKNGIFWMWSEIIVCSWTHAMAGLASDGRQIVTRARSEAASYLRYPISQIFFVFEMFLKSTQCILFIIQAHVQKEMELRFNSMGLFVRSWSYMISHWLLCLQNSIISFPLVVPVWRQCLTLMKSNLFGFIEG